MTEFKRQTRKELEKATLENMRVSTIVELVKNSIYAEALGDQANIDSGNKSGKSSQERTNTAIEVKNMRIRIRELEAQGITLERDLKLVEERLNEK